MSDTREVRLGRLIPFSEAEWARVAEAAEEDGVAVSTFVRELVLDFLLVTGEDEEVLVEAADAEGSRATPFTRAADAAYRKTMREVRVACDREALGG